jgi:hypothetical protein
MGEAAILYSVQCTIGIRSSKGGSYTVKCTVGKQQKGKRGSYTLGKQQQGRQLSSG